MLGELRGMVPALLVCNAVVLVGCAIYVAVTGGLDISRDWRLLSGLVLGNAAMVGNFCFLGFKAAKIIRRKERRYAQMYGTFGFIARYLGAFALFGALITFNIINPITAVIPLFYPKVHYTVKAILNKEL